MLVRIVKLSISPENADSFLANFEANKISIRAFEGCNFLELYRDQNNTDLFFTYSQKKIWIITETQNYLTEFGQKQKKCSTENLRLGVWTNWRV